MEINWIIIAVVLVFAIVLIVYLIKRNMKDKEDVINSLNEPEIEDDPKPKEKEEN
jgi:p-aminobenzoyl-glutamate transporter AbgT